jgi:hypothetical protein
MITGGDILKMDETLLIKVFPFHNFLAHKLDKQEMEATIRQGNNVTQL